MSELLDFLSNYSRIRLLQSNRNHLPSQDLSSVPFFSSCISGLKCQFAQKFYCLSVCLFDCLLACLLVSLGFLLVFCLYVNCLSTGLHTCLFAQTCSCLHPLFPISWSVVFVFYVFRGITFTPDFLTSTFVLVYIKKLGILEAEKT